MPVKIEEVKKETLTGFNVPANVISYFEIIQTVSDIIAKYGFSLVQESYKATLKGTIAVGIYCIKKDSNHYLFTWSHAYDKSQKFKCAFGLYEGYATGSDKELKWFCADEKEYKSINQNMTDIDVYIDSQFSDFETKAIEYIRFMNQCTDRKIDFEVTAALLGRLFVVEGIITSSQLNNIKSDLFLISGLDLNKVYKCISHNMNDTHPSSFMDNYSALYQFFVNEFNSTAIQALPVDRTVDIDKEELIRQIEEFKKQPFQVYNKYEEVKSRPVSEKLTRTVVFL